MTAVATRGRRGHGEFVGDFVHLVPVAWRNRASKDAPTNIICHSWDRDSQMKKWEASAYF